jgi:molecular chaperone GrpE
MSGRYGDPRRAPQSVPRALALELARERDAYAQALGRAKARVEELEATAQAPSRDAERAERAEAKLDALSRERDALAAERDALAAERDAWRAEREELLARLSQAEEAAAEAAEVEPDEAPDLELARLERRVQELLGDLERLKRRQRAELDARSRKGARDALAGMLEVRDNMVRALALLAGDGGPWEEGFASVLGQLDGALERAGVRAFGEVGERFDPMIHEAVGVEPGGEVESGALRRVERVGFEFTDGALLRPAQVVVAA